MSKAFKSAKNEHQLIDSSELAVNCTIANSIETYADVKSEPISMIRRSNFSFFGENFKRRRRRKWKL